MCKNSLYSKYFSSKIVLKLFLKMSTVPSKGMEKGPGGNFDLFCQCHIHKNAIKQINNSSHNIRLLSMKILNWNELYKLELSFWTLLMMNLVNIDLYTQFWYVYIWIYFSSLFISIPHRLYFIVVELAIWLYSCICTIVPLIWIFLEFEPCLVWDWISCLECKWMDSRIWNWILRVH